MSLRLQVFIVPSCFAYVLLSFRAQSKWFWKYIFVLLVFKFFSKKSGILFEILNLFIDGWLNTDIDFSLFCLNKTSVTISFLRIEMLLASSSRVDFSFFHEDSDCMFRNTISNIKIQCDLFKNSFPLKNYHSSIYQEYFNYHNDDTSIFALLNINFL